MWSGFLPSQIHQQELFPKSIQVCNGTPGTIPLLISAAWEFPDMRERLLETA
jgi:hypothetical protein